MKSTFQSLTRYPVALQELLVGVVLFGAVSIQAQNLLQNGDFEQPLGPTNWTVVYPYGGPGDMSIVDRTTFSARNYGSGFGGHIRSVHDGNCEVYLSQTVSNLAPGNYTLSGYMKYWEYTFELNDKFDVYFEAVGGQGTNKSPNITAMDDANLKTNSDYHLYSVTNTPDANGRIEVRLRMNQRTTTCCDKLYYKNAMWDDMSLTLTP